MERIKGMDEFKIDITKVCRYLKLLKLHNPIYKNIKISHVAALKAKNNDISLALEHNEGDENNEIESDSLQYVYIDNVPNVDETCNTMEFLDKIEKCVSVEEEKGIFSDIDNLEDSQSPKKIQILLSKSFVPCIAGNSFPKWAGERYDTKFNSKNANKWAEYVAVTFMPWGPKNQKFKCDYDTIEQILKEWKDGTEIQKLRFAIIQNMATGTTVSTTMQKLFAEFRGLYADKWSVTQNVIAKSISTDLKDNLHNGYDFDPEELYELLDNLILKRIDAKCQEYLRKTQILMDVIFENNLPASRVNFQDEIFSDLEVKTTMLKVAALDEYETLNEQNTYFNNTNQTIELNDDQRKIYEYVINNSQQKLIMIHGGPGTGKSTLINEFIQFLGKRNVSCCATTGIAASVLLNGKTIESNLNIPVRNTDKIVDSITDNNKLFRLQQKFNGIRMLVIDEISMVGYTKFINIDHRLNKYLIMMLLWAVFLSLSLVISISYHQSETNHF